MSKAAEKSKEEKEANEKKPTGVTGILATITGLIIAMATLITALPTLINAINGLNPTPTPAPTASPAAFVMRPTATDTDYCPMFKYYEPDDDLIIYEVSAGIPKNIQLKHTQNQNFTLRFTENGVHVGGMKLKWNDNNSFTIFSFVDKNCLGVSPDDTGKATEILKGAVNDFPGATNYSFQLDGDIQQRILKVNFRHK